MIQGQIQSLLKATSNTQIESIINRIQDDIEWEPLGNNRNNSGIIRMGSNPFDGITERITNAMDAMIELEVEKNPELRRIKKPRSVVEAVHNVRGGNLREVDSKTMGILASDIKVKFLDSEKKKSPTIEICDRGIGQNSRDFTDTLLSLNSDYKVSKLYLIGAFGQGGQTSFGNCKYGVIISRKYPALLSEGHSDVVGWSIVRYHDPSSETVMYKTGRWEYCVDKTTGRVPEVNPNKMPIAFNHGTIVRLIAYDLPKGTSDVLQPAGTGWSFLSQSLFDSILPIRLYEGRARYEEKNRPLSGLASRLWRGGRGEKVSIENDTYTLDLGSKYGHIIINYWILKPIEEPDQKSKWSDIRKGFVSRGKAVFITLNGQRHGEEFVAFLRDQVNLVYSDQYVIVQIDCDDLTNEAKKGLLSSTRERLKEGEMKEIILDEVARHLREDRNLIRFEKERKDAILNAKTRKDASKIRKLVGKFISKNPELNELIIRSSTDKTQGVKQVQEEDSDEDEITEEELEIPDLKPIPTYLRLANIKDPIPVEKGGSALLRLETDAEDIYLEAENEDRFQAYHLSGLTRERSRSKLRNGKLSYNIYCPQSVRVGNKELIKLELNRPDESPLIVEREIICIKPYKRKKHKKDTKLPEPNIIAIVREDSQWDELGYNEKSVGQVYLKGKDSSIIISLENRDLKNALNNLASSVSKEEIVESVKDRYSAAVAYYLLLQFVDDQKSTENNIDHSPDSMELIRMAKAIALLSLPMDAL